MSQGPIPVEMEPSSTPIAPSPKPRPDAGEQETPTICGSADRDDDVLSPQNSPSGQEQERTVSNQVPNQPKPLADRIPTPQRVLEVLRGSKAVDNIFAQSESYNDDKGRELLLDEDIWAIVNDELLSVLQKCAASGQKDVPKMIKQYMRELSRIAQEIAAVLYQHSSSFEGTTMGESLRVETSVMLQCINYEYVEVFQDLISHPLSKGEKFSIVEQVQQKVEHASNPSVRINDLFPDPKNMKSSYYLTGFLGRQAEKEAGRRAKGSGVGICMAKIAADRFLVPNASAAAKLKIEELLKDDDVPTEMVQSRLAFGGLHFPDKKCWEFFAIVEYIYSHLATTDNFLCRGGLLLCEICEAILHNNNMQWRFASLCGYDSDKETSEFNLDDTTKVFEYFLRVFGRVRAKDVALKYNSASYKKGKHTVALRAELAAKIGTSKKKSKKAAPVDEPDPSNDTEPEVTATDAKEAHDALLTELKEFDRETAEDSNTKKICTTVEDEEDLS